MSGELEAVLRLVAEGRLTAAEAAPLVAALQDREPDGGGDAAPAGQARRSPGRTAEAGGRPSAEQLLAGRRVRLYVGERGRSVLDLQIPLTLAGFAIDRIPGLSDDNRARIVDAVRTGRTGPILEVNDDGDEVRIVIE